MAAAGEAPGARERRHLGLARTKDEAGPSDVMGAASRASQEDTAARLSPRARRIALALAEALFAEGGERVPPVSMRTVERVEALVAGMGRGALSGYGGLLEGVEQMARASSGGRPFTALPRAEASRLLERWQQGNTAARALGLASLGALKMAHLDDPRFYAALGCAYRFDSHERPARAARAIRGETLVADETVECDVVVVGTGAGGAVVAKELAARGLAVLLLEEGEYNARPEFNGRAAEGVRRLWRDGGVTGTLGNGVISIPLGRTVGGSTAINTGTCWRAPDWVLSEWAKKPGLGELSTEGLAPYYERVEQELQVTRAEPSVLGGTARVVARGCDVLGYSHRALDRNAPGCDGAGVCDFGCPTGARRSTDVSYVPSALGHGAELRTGLRVEGLRLEAGRARGVTARSLATGHTLTVDARATVLACGAFHTPVLLEQQGLGRGLPELGRNLSVHPATSVSALFDEEIRGYSAIPQGYCVDEFHRDGVLFMGAAMPPDVGAVGFPLAGEALVRLMDHYDRVATMGVMVEDDSRGSVRSGPGGRPLATYWLGEKERSRLTRGVATMARIFLAGGASEVFTTVAGHAVLRGPEDLARLRDARPAARDFVMMGFHPLGTCRMGSSPRAGVVSPEHEVFGVRDLFVVDGSVLPGAPAVNPQVTIMAFATRAADQLASRLGATA